MSNLVNTKEIEFYLINSQEREIVYRTTFMKKHPRVGKPTYFREKLWSALIQQGVYKSPDLLPYMENRITPHLTTLYYPKLHTMRFGNRWKVGDTFDPRYWSGLPYRSKQTQFAPRLTIKRIWNFKVDHSPKNKRTTFYINDRLMFDHHPKKRVLISPHNLNRIARLDGLSTEDFLAWFNKSGEGQIICPFDLELY